MSTGEHMRCEGERLETGAEVRIQGASDTRRPWSAWFSSLPVGSADGNGGGRGTAGCSSSGGRCPRAANIRSRTSICRSLQRRARAFSFRAARRRAAGGGSARARVLGGRVSPATSAGSAWGEFAAARVRELYPNRRRRRSPNRPIRATRDTARSPRRPSRRQGQGEGRTRRRPSHAGRNGARRGARDRAAPRPVRAGAPDGHHDRDDVAAGDAADRSRAARRRRRTRDGGAVRAEAAVVQAAPLGGDDGGARARPVSAASRWRPRRPPGFYYVRFRTISHLIRLRDELDAGLATRARPGWARARTTIWPARYEAELGLRQGPLTKLLGPTVVDDLAVVGSDPYLREGSDLSFVFRVRARPAFEAALAGTLAAFGAAHGGLKSVTIDHQGTPITITRSSDGVVRRHRATVGGFDVVSNSLAATKRVIDADRGARAASRRRARLSLHAGARRGHARRRARVSQRPLRRRGDRPAPEGAGGAPADRARRAVASRATRRCSTAGCTDASPASADEIVASGLLKRDELAHAGGERIDWQPGRGARSSWGAVGGLTPLIDLPAPAKVTPSEKAAYDIFVTGYQSFWRTSIDPVAIRLTLPPDGRGPLSADVRVLPIITGTDYADMLRTVGRARVDLAAGTGGLRTAIGIGADAEIRRLVTRSLREMPMVGVVEGGLAGRLGDGGHGRHRHAGVARSDQEGSDDGRVGPIAARLRRPARLRGHRGAQHDGGGGVPGGRARTSSIRRRPGAIRVGRGGQRARRSVRGRARRCGVRRGDARTSPSTTRSARARSCCR